MWWLCVYVCVRVLALWLVGCMGVLGLAGVLRVAVVGGGLHVVVDVVVHVCVVFGCVCVRIGCGGWRCG